MGYRWTRQADGWRKGDAFVGDGGGSTPDPHGMPADGDYYIGWSLGPGNSTIAAARLNPGWPGDEYVSVIHDYSGYSDSTIMQHSKIQSSVDQGFIPSLSFKGGNGSTGYLPAQIAAGSADAAIDASAAYVKSLEPWPVWLCYYHEPEDNFAAGAPAAGYRAAYRYIVQRFRDADVTNVAWHPIYMNPYTFLGYSGRDWREWHPDYLGSGVWATDIMSEVFGADTYTPMPGGTSLLEFGEDMFDVMRAKTEAAGVPPEITKSYVIPEFGMSYNSTPTPDWVEWAITARDYAKAHNVKSFQYWDNSTVQPGRYSFGPVYDPSGNKLAGWNVLVAGSVTWGGI